MTTATITTPDGTKVEVALGSFSNAIAADQLRTIIERIERLDQEAKSLNEDRRDVLAEAKGNGFDVKVIKRIVAMRRKDHAERKEEEAILELYLEALGMS